MPPVTEIPFKEILLLLLGTLSTYLVWRVQYQKDRLKTIESQLSDKKYAMYSEVLYLFFDIALGNKMGSEISEQETITRIYKIKKDMFLYAPDKIFVEFTNWISNLNVESSSPTLHFKNFYKVLLLIRKEMGNNKTKITLDDFMIFYMQSRTEYAKFKIQNGW